MDVTTGQIKEFVSPNMLQEALKTGNWIELDRMPDPKCKKCYGRGNLGRNVATNLYIPCRCVKKEELLGQIQVKPALVNPSSMPPPPNQVETNA